MTNLRNHPEWPLMMQMRRAGYPIDKVAAFFEIPVDDLHRTFGSWPAVERTSPKVAKDGTTTCPRCGNETWPVLFGMWLPTPGEPAPKAFMAGCVIGQDEPEWRCTNEDCGYEWRVQAGTV